MTDEDQQAGGFAALRRLTRTNEPGRCSLAGAYALGYGALGMAQSASPDGYGQDWYQHLDPLDTLFLGAIFPHEIDDRYAFANARDAWLRALRPTGTWQAVERFVTEVITASQEHELPVDEGDLMLLVVSRLESAGLDQRKLPAALQPRRVLAQARCFTTPVPGLVLAPAPGDAPARIARLWAGTDVDLPHDGTIVDALREGLHLLAAAGGDVRSADPLILVLALYVALVVDDDPSERALASRAWAMGLPAESPLASVVDTVLAGAERNLDIDTVLGHLYGMASFDAPIPDTDRRAVRLPGRALVDAAFELGFVEVDTRDAKIMKMGDHSRDMMAAQLRAFEEKFGRPPGPDDPVFFDPDADEPQSIDRARFEAAGTAYLEAAGVSGAWIYASQHNDGLLPLPDGSFRTEADQRDWREAIDRYRRTHPDEPVEDDLDLQKFGAAAALGSLALAHRDEEYGAVLAAKLHQRTSTTDSDTVAVREFLASAGPLVDIARSDPETSAAAIELARAWSGTDLATRVSAQATRDSDDLDADVQLVFAVAGLDRMR